MTDGPLIVQSDKTVLLEIDHELAGAARAAIAPFAELERAPEHVHTYRITPLALWNARAAGHDAEQVVDALVSFSRYAVPQPLLVDIVDIRARRARVPTPQRHRAHRPMQHPSNETLSAIVAVLRKVTSAPFGSVRIDPAVAMSLLQRAARQDETVLINYVDAAGVATQRVVAPITVAGGQLVAFDSASSRAREFAIHRITSVVPADDEGRR